MKIVATIEARMGSSRLPGKTMMKIVGKPMLELLIERLKRSKLINHIVVATTTEPEDNIIEMLAKSLNIGIFRGSSEDVLDRVLRAAKKCNAEIIVEITGDCPLIDPEIVDKVIRKYLENNYDYVGIIEFPRGLDTQVFPTKVLEEVSKLTDDPADRENVSLYIYEHPEKYKLGHISLPPEIRRPDLRLTVDTKEDFELVRRAFEGLYNQNPNFTTKDVIGFIDKNNLQVINAHIKQKPVR